MAVKLTTTGSGSVGDVQTGWTVTENSTSVNVADSGGGTGAVSLSTKAKADSKFVIDNNAVFEHPKLGTITGTVTNTSVTDYGVGMAVAPMVSLLSVERTMPPTGSQPLSEIIAQYVGAVTDKVTVEYQATNNPTRVYIGWTGDVWYHLNQLAAINKVEIVVVGTALIVRDLGSAILSIDDKNSTSTSYNTQGGGRNVQIVNHNAVLVPTLPGFKYNYSTNPGVETNTLNWGHGFAGTLTVTGGRSTVTPLHGSASYRLVVTATAPPLYTGDITAYNRIPVGSIAADELMSFSVLVNFSKGINYGHNIRDIRVSAVWRNASNVILRRDASPVTSVTVGTLYAGTNVPINFSVQNLLKPTGAVNVDIEVYIPAYDSLGVENVVVDDILKIDCVMLTNGSITSYGDGSTAGWSWLGTTNNSVSSTTIPVENDFYNARREGNTIYSVNAGETIRTTIQNDNHPTFLAQPRHAVSLPVGVGEYYVTAADGLVVTPTQWREAGGSVTVAIGTIPGTMELVVKAPPFNIIGLPGPYILGYLSGSTQVAALMVAGIGVITDPETVLLGSGANEENTTNEIASKLDSPFVSNRTAMYDASSWMTIDAAGPVITLSATVGTHQLEGFGLTPGSLIKYKDCIYRISQAIIGNVETTITAKWFVRASELETLWSGQTAEQFDTAWSGYLSGDLQVAPLQKVS